MEKGCITQVGTPEDLYKRPASSFIGDANLINGCVKNRRFKSGGLNLPLIGPDGAALISIRPEGISLRVTRSAPGRLISAT